MKAAGDSQSHPPSTGSIVRIAFEDFAESRQSFSIQLDVHRLSVREEHDHFVGVFVLHQLRFYAVRRHAPGLVLLVELEIEGFLLAFLFNMVSIGLQIAATTNKVKLFFFMI